MAVASPVYVSVLDEIVDAIEEIATSERATSAALGFSVEGGRSRAYVETVKNKALVNVVLNRIDPDAERSSIHGQMDKITIHVNMYVKGNDDSLNPADVNATERLLHLTAQVRYALTQLKNKDFGLAVGQIDTRSSSIVLQFFPHDDESASVYAPARAIVTLYIPYDAADTADRTAIASVRAASIDAATLEIWATRYIIAEDEEEE